MKNNQICPEDHVNGWPVIQRFLAKNHCTQSVLAEHLKMSPSAVSQIKQGLFLLSAEQLRLIVDFLQMDDAGISEFYTQVFRGRLLGKEERGQKKVLFFITGTPCVPETRCRVEWLEDYEPIKESFSSYISRRGLRDTGVLLIQWQAENAPSGISGAGTARLRYDDHPEQGDVVLLKCRGLPCRITRFNGWTSTGGLFADLAADSPEKCILFPGIMWVHPADDLQFISPEHQEPVAP